MAQRTTQAAHKVVDGIRQAFRGKLTLTQTADPIARVQVLALADETLQDLEQFQQFGFTSHAPSGTEVIVVPLGGDTTHGIVIASENGSFRVKNLQSGEVAVYDASGSSIILRQGKLIEIDCDTLHIKAKNKVKIDSPMVEASEQVTAQGLISGNAGLAINGNGGGKVQINCDIAHTGTITNNGKDIGANHTHPETNSGNTLGVN